MSLDLLFSPSTLPLRASQPFTSYHGVWADCPYPLLVSESKQLDKSHWKKNIPTSKKTKIVDKADKTEAQSWAHKHKSKFQDRFDLTHWSIFKHPDSVMDCFRSCIKSCVSFYTVCSRLNQKLWISASVFTQGWRSRLHFSFPKTWTGTKIPDVCYRGLLKLIKKKKEYRHKLETNLGKDCMWKQITELIVLKDPQQCLNVISQIQ